MKVWISKYALSQGIFEIDADLSNTSDGLIVHRRERFACNAYYHGEGREWHRSREGAEERAEVMRENKIRSLEKQIKKLSQLSFEVKHD